MRKNCQKISNQICTAQRQKPLAITKINKIYRNTLFSEKTNLPNICYAKLFRGIGDRNSLYLFCRITLKLFAICKGIAHNLAKLDIVVVDRVVGYGA